MSAAKKIDWSHKGPTTSGDRPATPAADGDRELGVHMGAYSWIQRLGTRRGRTRLAEADKPLLMHLWSFASYALRGDARAEQVRPSRARLARETGATLSAIKGRLSRLAEAGWIRRRGRGWDLAWQVPFTERPAAQSAAPEPPPVVRRTAVQAAGAEPERPLKRPGAGRSSGRHDHTIEQRENWDQTNSDHDHVDDHPRGRSREGESIQLDHDPRAGGQRVIKPAQQPLFEGAPDTESKPPQRDRAMEVFAYLRERIIATKVDLKISPARGPTVLSTADRKAIEARIREQDEADPHTPDAGVTACKQVIDVDEAEARANQEIGAYWNATTPFRNSRNFEQRLLRWRADGRHRAFGAAAGEPTGRLRRSKNDLGWRPHMTAEEEDAIWESVKVEGSE